MFKHFVAKMWKCYGVEINVCSVSNIMFLFNDVDKIQFSHDNCIGCIPFLHQFRLYVVLFIVLIR